MMGHANVTSLVPLSLFGVVLCVGPMHEVEEKIG